MRTLFLLLSLLPTIALSYPLVPDAKSSPGDLCEDDDADFVEYRYEEEIPYCERNVSNALKSAIYDEYEIPKAERKSYTIDHIIPLSIGGDNHRENLWPEHKAVKATRPKLEMELYTKLRDGRIRQKEAIRIVLEVKFEEARKADAARIAQRAESLLR